MAIKMGDKVKDVIEGIEGIVVAKAQYLYGCTQFQVQPSVGKDGAHIKSVWIDEPQLKIVVKDWVNKQKAKRKTKTKKKKRVYRQEPPGGGEREHPDD